MLGSSPVRIPVPSTEVMLLRMGEVIPKRSLTMLPFASLICRVTERFSRLVLLPLLISRLPRKAARVITASWSILITTLAQTLSLLGLSTTSSNLSTKSPISPKILLKPLSKLT